MDQDESIALWLKGKDAWNAWAEDILRQKAELEKAGVWNGDKSLEQWSDETRKWNDAAETQMFGLRLMTRAFADTAEKQVGPPEEYSGRADANIKTLIIDGDYINFNGFVFPWQAWFSDAQFHGGAQFEGAQFHGSVGFLGAQFHEGGDFEEAQFHGPAWFSDAQFHGDAQFWRVEFQGQAQFANTNFESAAVFRDASFGSKEKPKFADFTAIKADRAFDLTGAQFSKVPAFNQADFKQAPDLDNVSFPARPFWRGGDKDLVPQYRALKRLAVQGHDYEREQMAFKGELRSRRWVIDKWYGPSVWLGMFYDFLSDCGRSIWRPFVAWAALVLGFAAFYFWRSTDGLATRCGSLETPLQALYLSIKNGLVLFGGTRDTRINQAYLCLYGGDANQAAIPLSVTYVETVLQTPISAVLLFLFLLAVRNQFKIK
jgi:hypothetical protein